MEQQSSEQSTSGTSSVDDSVWRKAYDKNAPLQAAGRTAFVEAAEDVFVFERPLTAYPLGPLPLELGARMTVVRLADQQLLVSSPVHLDRETLREVQALGTVRYVLWGCLTHHVFAVDWLQHFPTAQFWAPKGMEVKRKDVPWTGLLSDDTSSRLPWSDDFDTLPYSGVPALNEFVLYHKRSKTLICTDMLLHFTSDSSSGLSKFIGAVGGFLNRFSFAGGSTSNFPIADQEAMERSLRAIYALPFERVIPTHGAIAGGKEETHELFKAAANKQYKLVL